MVDTISDSRASVEVYRLLSRLWLREIDAELLSRLQSEPMRSALSELGMEVPASTVDELGIEYCRLFVGPRDHMPPVQSVWLRSELDTELTTSVRHYAELLGYGLYPQDMPDHLGVQLGLMAHAISLVEENPGTQEYQEIASDFFRRHLTWPTDLLQAVQKRSDASFYASLAAITQQFLKLEQVNSKHDAR